MTELPARYDHWAGLTWTAAGHLVAVGRAAYSRPDGNHCTECPDETQLFIVDPNNGTVSYRSPVRSRATRFLAVVDT